MKQITITVAPDGSAKVETKGFEGNSCRTATADLERALGKTVSDNPTMENFSGQSIPTQNRS